MSMVITGVTIGAVAGLATAGATIYSGFQQAEADRLALEAQKTAAGEALAAQKEGDANALAAQTAAAAAAQATMDANAQLARDQYTKAQADYTAMMQPYLDTGTQALNAQKDLSGANGPDAQRAAVDQLANNPEFGAMVQQGEQGMLQNASATGGLRGGNTQGALAQFRPAMLSQLIDQQYNRLGGLAQMGYGSAGQIGQAGMQAGQGLGNTYLAQGQFGANTQLGLGDAQAGYQTAIGDANAGYQSALGGYNAGMASIPGAGQIWGNGIAAGFGALSGSLGGFAPYLNPRGATK